MIKRFSMATQQGGHESSQFSSEVSRNVYLSYSETNQKLGVHQFPGLKLRASGSGADRGDHVMNEVRYVINGAALYKEDSLGARSSLGTVSGSDRAIFADDGANLYFTANNSLYKYDGSTVTTVTQSVVTNPSSIAYINRQFIITGDNGLFGTSDVADGSTYNALNYAEAETKPDPLIRVYQFSQLVYFMGSQTIELWRNTGSGNPPFARQDTSLVNVGIIGKYAVTNTDRYMYWMGDDRKLYKCVGANFETINTSGVSHVVESFATASDCIASSFTLKGQDFVLFKFPSAGYALLYSENNQYWSVLSSGTDKNFVNSWYGNSVSQCYGKNLVTDYRNGNTYELDISTYTDNGDTILHIVVPKTFSSEDIGGSGRIIATQAFINMQAGVGLATGQGSNPVLMCQFSNDGGEVWNAENFVEIGVMGDYTKRVQFDQFSNGYQIKLRVMWSDPVPVTMWDGEIDLVPGGF